MTPPGHNRSSGVTARSVHESKHHKGLLQIIHRHTVGSKIILVVEVRWCVRGVKRRAGRDIVRSQGIRLYGG